MNMSFKEFFSGPVGKLWIVLLIIAALAAISSAFITV